MTNRKNIAHRLLALILSCALLLTGCMGNSSSDNATDASSSSSGTTTTQDTTSNTIESETEKPSFDQLSDPELAQYIEDDINAEFESALASDDYHIDNIASVYVSKNTSKHLNTIQKRIYSSDIP